MPTACFPSKEISTGMSIVRVCRLRASVKMQYSQHLIKFAAHRVSNETSGHNGRIASSMSGGQTSLYTEDLMIPLRDVLREIDTRASLGASRGEGCGYYGRASFESLSRSRDVTLFDKSQTSFLRPDGQRSRSVCVHSPLSPSNLLPFSCSLFLPHSSLLPLFLIVL